MQQLIYSMQFKGRAAPVEGSSGVLQASTSAPSCTITSLVGPEVTDHHRGVIYLEDV